MKRVSPPKALVAALISPFRQLDEILAGGGIANARAELQKSERDRRLVAAWERPDRSEGARATA